MKTLLIVGRVPVPATLRDVVERGSTSVVEARAAEVPSAASNADRVVVWAASGDAAAAELARAYVRGATPERRTSLLVVSPEADGAVPGIAATEAFVWPRDEDRLRMAFMTGG